MAKNIRKTLILALVAGLAAFGAANAQDAPPVVDVGNPAPGAQAEDLITGSTTWTPDNVYNLVDQIFVMPGATLTIEAGTRVASTPTENGSGSLAVTRGAQIMVLGTAEMPVVMTSALDQGLWREAANEWGNLTIMGDALVSASRFGGEPVIILEEDGVTSRENTAVPDGLNQRVMEGLVAEFPGDQKVLFGGMNDNDDSGIINYLSIRFGGRVVGLGNELNGLSLGGIGRETDIDFVEIMNNVDDGIEIWGGTVNLKHFVVWNVGDDSFDVDAGWRGHAQFGLIVQGFSLDASQGSGVGDNAFEIDGAEDSDAQPVTTAVIYNATVIGQPIDGDQGTAWRDGARVQYRNSIFMNVGDQVVKNDGDDGDGASGYGHNGTLTFEALWMTPATATSAVNAGVCATPGDFDCPDVLYTAQVDGNLAEISGSIFFQNVGTEAYTEATARGVFEAASNNLMEPANMPITSISRAQPVMRGGKVMLLVTQLDPRAANDAVTHSVTPAPANGFFDPAAYVGAFSATENWLLGWSAAFEFGFTQ